MDFFWNFCNLKDNPTPEFTHFVKYPTVDMVLHVTFKTTQVAAVLAGLVVSPIYRKYLWARIPINKRTVNTPNIVRVASNKVCVPLLHVGLISGPVVSLAYIKYNNLKEADLRERALLLRFNKKNLWVDRVTFAFGLIGFYTKKTPGAIIGINLAFVWAVFYYLFLWNERRNVLRELYPHFPDSYMEELARQNITTIQSGCDLINKHQVHIQKREGYVLKPDVAVPDYYKRSQRWLEW